MKIVITLATLIFAFPSFAQQTEGQVIYSRSFERPAITESLETEDKVHPAQKVIIRFELNFTSLYMTVRPIATPSDKPEGGSSAYTIYGSVDDVTYCDFRDRRLVKFQEKFQERYLIRDSVQALDWQYTDETKTILGHICHKATATYISTGTRFARYPGDDKFHLLNDTAVVVAWYTVEIPVAAGPEFPGQLPGLILALESDSPSMNFVATEILDRPNQKLLREPKRGKRVSQRHFQEIIASKLQEDPNRVRYSPRYRQRY